MGAGRVTGQRVISSIPSAAFDSRPWREKEMKAAGRVMLTPRHETKTYADCLPRNLTPRICPACRSTVTIADKLSPASCR
jgi:hypothetical protein